MAPIPTVRLGKTNVLVPRVSLGTWSYGGENHSASGFQVGWSGHDDKLARAALSRAYELGITHWDTADVYGNGRSEALIGEMFATIPRDRIFLATKVGYYLGGFPHYYHPDLVSQQIDQSLRRLKTDVIDLLYLHHCDFGPEDRWLLPALELLRKAQQAGKIRFIGLSDWRDRAIMRVISIVQPEVVQPCRNVTRNVPTGGPPTTKDGSPRGDVVVSVGSPPASARASGPSSTGPAAPAAALRGPDLPLPRDTFQSSGLAAYCDRHDLGVAFFSPLRHGLLLGKYAAPMTFPEGDFRNTDKGFSDAHLLHRLAENAAALRARFMDRAAEPVIAALVAACLTDCPRATVLLGQRNPSQVEAAAAAASLVLADDELAWVRSLYAGIPAT